MVYFAFIFGALIGSFLNVVIYRLPLVQSLGGRSYCPHCHRQLTWLDLVPVLSFVFLRGRCRACRERISFRYVIGELVIAFGFAFGAWWFHPLTMAEGLPFALWCLLWSVGFVTFVIDLEHFLILDKVTFWGTVLVFVLLAIFSLVPGKGPQVLSTTIFTAAIGVLVGPLPFLVLWYVSKGRWLGFGDVKFMVFLGALLGSPLVFLAQLFAF
jgi:leader peptidase (prepilin peptidase)/N-methyltransferase